MNEELIWSTDDGLKWNSLVDQNNMVPGYKKFCDETWILNLKTDLTEFFDFCVKEIENWRCDFSVCLWFFFWNFLRIIFIFDNISNPIFKFQIADGFSDRLQSANILTVTVKKWDFRWNFLMKRTEWVIPKWC